MANDYTRMQDITLHEKSIWTQYTAYWNVGDINSAITVLTDEIAINDSFKYKIFNSFNWNRLINAVNDGTEITDPTYESLVGKWNIDYAILQTASADFKVFESDWSDIVAYVKNNIVVYNNVAYLCIQDNTNKNPETETSYWEIAQSNAESTGIQVSETTPSNLLINDIYLNVNSILYALARTTTETTIVVTRGGIELSDGAAVVSVGDILTITATASSGFTLDTLTVNGDNFTSGNTYEVTTTDVSIVAISIGETYILTNTSLETLGGHVKLMDTSDNYYSDGAIVASGTTIKVEVYAVTTQVVAYLDGEVLGDAFFGTEYYTFELSGDITMSNYGYYSIYITQTP